MKRLLVVLTLAALVVGAALAVRTTSAEENTAVSIPILNPQFTVDALACSPGTHCAYPSISGWICGPQTDLEKLSTVQFPMAPPGGLYVASLGNANASGSILQTLGDAVSANTTYTLTVSVGARADVDPFTGYTALLMAGNVILASGNSKIPAGGTFVNDVIVYNSGAKPDQFGRPLQIFITSVGFGQAEIDNVTLTAQPSAQ